MFFKTLEIQGFKSFADKTVLTFDTRMTGVVGSNGQGKSNIADSLRWVMGEQGAKSLRSEKMEDVIFHGTETRKAVGAASVALTIDNTDRALSEDSDTVIIKRKLLRTGESEFSINGERKRLRDIQDLLRGTGLGRDGYSVIGQGRISEIISSKIKERREIFEEAAGVSKFLHEKAEAEKILLLAEENILRLFDIYEELGKRLPILEKQTEKAKKAIYLKKREENLDIFLSDLNLKKIKLQLDENSDIIWKNEGQCGNYLRILKSLEQEREELTNEKLRLNAELNDIQVASEKLNEEAGQSIAKIAVSDNEISHNNSKIQELYIKIEDTEGKIKDVSKREKELNLKIEEKKDALKLLKEQQAEKEIQQQELKNSSETTVEDKYINEQMSEYTTAKARYIALKESAETRINTLLKETDDFILETKDTENHKENIKSKITELENKLIFIKSEKESNQNKYNGSYMLLENKRKKLETASLSYEEIRSEHSRISNRYHALFDIEQNMSGYKDSSKSILFAKKNGRLSGIHGAFAELISLDPEFALAIETTAGAALNNIVVEDENAAKRSIIYLKETRGGVATFLPLNIIKPSNFNFPSDLRFENGFIGIANELVKTDDIYKNIVSSILGRTAIVDDMTTASRIGRKFSYKFRMVTLEGDQIHSGGAHTGGDNKSHNSGILARKKELDVLSQKITELDDKLEICKTTKFTLSENVRKAEIELSGLLSEKNSLETEETTVKADLAAAKSIYEQLLQVFKTASETLSKKELDINSCKAEIEEYNKNLSEIDLKVKALEQEAAKISEKLSITVRKREKISEELSELKQLEVGISKDIEMLSSELSGLLKETQYMEDSIKEFSENIKVLENLNKEFETEIANLKALKSEHSSIIARNKAKSAAIISKRDEAERRQSEINVSIKEKSAEKEEFTKILAKAQEKEESLKNELEKIKKSLWSNYEITPSEAAEKALLCAIEIQKENNIDELDYQKASLLLQEVKQELAKLGSNINFSAVEEYKEVSERYEIMSKQLKDAKDSKSKTEALIAELTEKTKTQFLNSFNEISSNFSEIFTQIFAGGKARLELTEPEDILNSGIEIFAAPPGKLIKHLISLSGGEQTMVAVSIYLAILKHRPTPFCMLDEVDAALDEGNVVTYAKYLKKFAGKTQLMAITHRRGTMECCDVLYGVYMQEKGVSQLLRKELSGDEEE